MPPAAIAENDGLPSRRPGWLDLFICVPLTGAMLAEIFVNDIPGVRWLLIICAIVQGTALAWRREFPRTVAMVVVGANSLPNFFGTPSNESTTLGLIAIVLAMFALGRYGLMRTEDRRRTIAAFCVAVGFAFASSIYQKGVPGGDLIFISIFAVAPFAFGRAIAVSQRGRLEAEAATAELAVASAKLREVAVQDERERIARELHDVIAHSVSLMGLQAGAARKVLAPGNDAVEASLRSIEETGRDTLGELRRMLGVMRDAGEAGELAPQPGLAALPELIDQLRASGVAVEMTLGDGLTALSPGVDLAAYRIAQEALTNSVRHAPGKQIDVSAFARAERIELRILTRGASPEAGEKSEPGHGVVGMRERATLYGGSLSAGFVEGEGYVVSAELPAEYLASDPPAATVPRDQVAGV